MLPSGTSGGREGRGLRLIPHGGRRFVSRHLAIPSVWYFTLAINSSGYARVGATYKILLPRTIRQPALAIDELSLKLPILDLVLNQLYLLALLEVSLLLLALS